MDAVKGRGWRLLDLSAFDWTALVGYLFIFGARVVDVTCATLRVLLVVRGHRLFASALGIIEVTVYILALSRVINSLNEPLRLAIYALGFATGNYVGSLVEEKMAIGHMSAQVVPMDSDPDILAGLLREDGFGVTTLTGEGREGPRKLLFISFERKAKRKLMRLIEKNDPGAFVTMYESRGIQGGVFNYRKGK